MKWTQEEIEERMKQVKQKNPYKLQYIYKYVTPWGQKRYTYPLSEIGFDTFEQAQKDQMALAQRHERLARMSMEQGHDMVYI